jgi:hypothetical protein
MAAEVCLFVILCVVVVQGFLFDLYVWRLERADARLIRAVQDAADDAKELLDERARESAAKRAVERAEEPAGERVQPAPEGRRNLVKKLALVAVAAVLVAGCNSQPGPVAEQAPAPSATTAAPTTTRPDPGVAACKTVARRAKAGATPTDLQRAAAWRQLQASDHEELKAVGAKLQEAWTAGGLADQLEANTNAAMACALYGVEVKVG